MEEELYIRGAAMNLPEYLTQDSAGYIHVTGHRIGLQDLVFFHNEGYSREMLLGQFPTLSLPVIDQVVSFYQQNRGEVDEWIARNDAEVEGQRAAAKKGPDLDELRRRAQAMRRAQGA
jgi:uncharacterized protein (DUF433 family)